MTANQDDELTDKETFQIEFDTKKDQWRVRTADNVYWKLADASGIQSTDDGRLVMNGMRNSHRPHVLSTNVAIRCGDPLLSVVEFSGIKCLMSYGLGTETMFEYVSREMAYCNSFLVLNACNSS